MEHMEHKSMWTVQEVEDLWGSRAEVIYDPHFHERLTSKKGPEFVAKLRKKHYHDGPYPGWSLSILRL